MQTRKRQSFIQGAMILTGATMVVKVIGMIYRIPLGNILGAGGMSHFQSAYSVFGPIYALSVAGFPVAVSKMVSEAMARRRYRDVRKIRRVSMLLFLLTGLGGSLLLFFGARGLSGLIGNPDAAMAVAAIAPSIFFCCLMSSYRGYYQGLGNMTPTAVSQVVESLVKLACGIALAWYVMQRGLGEYAASGTVFGTAVGSPEQAGLAVLPWAAAGAVLGVTASTAVGALVLFLRHLFAGDGLGGEELRAAPRPQPSGQILRTLLRLALPVCLVSAFAHITTVVDVATIMNRVGEAVAREPATVLGMYGGLLPRELPLEDLPSYLYGAFGYTTSLFNLVPAITATLGISALPAISAHWALGERRRAAEKSASVLKLTALVAIPAGLGLSALAEPVLALLYPARVAEVAIAAPLLRSMGFAAVLVGITTPMTSIFQAVGRADIPLKLMGLGAVLKTASNWVLLAVPGLNIYAAPVGTVLCYAFVLLGGSAALGRAMGERVPVLKVAGKPLLCGILCAVTAHTCYSLVGRMWHSRLLVLLAIAAGGLVYAIFVLNLKIITKNEAMLLPNGKKIVKILEKLSFLG